MNTVQQTWLHEAGLGTFMRNGVVIHMNLDAFCNGLALTNRVP